jgi:hypothetical protein
VNDREIQSPVLAQATPLSLVREATGTPWREWKPTIALAAGVGVGAALIVAAIVVRRRARAAPPAAPARKGSVVLKTLAGAMKLGRSERRGLEHLASAAGVREPAVLLLSPHAFQAAAARVIDDTPDAREGIAALAGRLGFDLDAGESGGRVPGRMFEARA